MSEIAHGEERTVLDLLKKLRNGMSDSPLRKKVMERVEERLGGVKGRQSEQRGTVVPYDYKYLIDDILPMDIEHCVEEYVQQGDIEIEEGWITITPRGGIKLANMAKMKLENLMKEGIGAHQIKDRGYGNDLASSSRKYVLGDDYKLIDITKTFLNSLERIGMRGNARTISLESEDFEVYERTYETRMCIALLIDESASMGQEKRSAAIDTCLALSKLREPQDLLKIFIYSSQVKEIPHWDILNVRVPGDITDMRLALKTARRSLRNQKGDKQVYLITDAEPNTENGKYIGFEKASPGVLREALYYRQEGITLNVTMLDEKPLLRQFASQLAKLNAGRAYFALASNLGKVVLEDYLATKRKSHRGS